MQQQITDWKKSIRSGHDGGNCVEVAEFATSA